VRRARGLVLGALIAFEIAGACNGEFRFDDVNAAPDAGPEDIGAGGKILFPQPDAGGPDAGGMDASKVHDAANDHEMDADANMQADTMPHGCVADADCKLASLHCDVVSGACFECVVDANCAAGMAHRCDAALHRCVECGVDGDCGSGQKCEPTTRRCVTTCDSILTKCTDGTYICDPALGFCVRCHGDVECVLPGDQNICDTANGKCVECVADTDCPKAKPRCDRTRGTCAACLAPSDCAPSTPLCDPATRTCVAG
jgi:Cys-rich repeat protein